MVTRKYLKSYKLQDRFQDQSAGFDLSPVRDPLFKDGRQGTRAEDKGEDYERELGKPSESHDTLSTTNPDCSHEKDMAYYLAKIKAKAAQKSQELRYPK